MTVPSQSGERVSYQVWLTPHQAHAAAVACDLYADEFSGDGHDFSDEDAEHLREASLKLCGIASEHLGGPNEPRNECPECGSYREHGLGCPAGPYPIAFATAGAPSSARGGEVNDRHGGTGRASAASESVPDSPGLLSQSEARERIESHIRALRGMAEHAEPVGVSGRQIVCSAAAMFSWADSLEPALAALLVSLSEVERELAVVRSEREEALKRRFCASCGAGFQGEINDA